MRYLGLDLGTKTLGISISDINGIIASKYKTIRYDGDNGVLIEQIKEIVTTEDIKTIVLGFPKNMNNTIGERAALTIEFKEKLESLSIPVFLQDERLSSVEANNYLISSNVNRKKRKKIVDNVAAIIILQTFLDKNNKGDIYDK